MLVIVPTLKVVLFARVGATWIVVEALPPELVLWLTLRFANLI